MFIGGYWRVEYIATFFIYFTYVALSMYIHIYDDHLCTNPKYVPYSVRVDSFATSVVTNDVPCHTTIVSVPSVTSLVADGAV